MNAWKLLAGLSLGLLCHSAQANEPIADLDKFEASYIACIEDEKAFPGHCLTGLFKSHALPWRKTVDLKRVEELLGKWVSKDGVYKVHSITRKDVASLYQRRWYLIENEAGGLMQLTIRFRAVKGQWYYGDMSMSNDEETLASITLNSTAPW
ncbi:MAG TPA: hypothetical protein VLC30_15230 [Pseudomonas sp.]|nr:hypothetical protein [Pseudomonas sp.]